MRVPVGALRCPPEHASAPGHLEWRTTVVQGRRANYGVAEPAAAAPARAWRQERRPPVLFLHGWALGQHAYKRPLKRLAHLGYRVFAPSLPGFGGTPELRQSPANLGPYATWASAFLRAVGVTEPAVVIGHSFGGGVAAQLAHDAPSQVAHTVLVDSVGGADWLRRGTRVWPMAQRPLWDWVLNLPADVVLGPGFRSVVSAIMEDALPNVLHNPLGLWRAGTVARRADLSEILAGVARRGVPVAVVWGNQDMVTPHAAFEALCAAAGCGGRIVPGGHCWLLSDPDLFGRVMDDCLDSPVPLTSLAAGS